MHGKGALKAPFPYYGGKARWADEIWRRFGKVDVYAEPFAGSLAVLLANPAPAQREVVCDLDGLLANFWRAVKADPEAVAHHADWPTIHQDLTARHSWLRAWAAEHRDLLSEDPEWCDAKAAGWWVWGISLWVGSGFGFQESDTRPQISDRFGGQGVNAQRDIAIVPWMMALCERMKRVIVLNRDWTSALTPTVMADTESATAGQKAVMLDPPYVTDTRNATLYHSDFAGTSSDVARASFEWAVKHGERYRIAYCCHDGDFETPPGWTKQIGRMTGRRTTVRAEAVLFSPACIEYQPRLL